MNSEKNKANEPLRPQSKSLVQFFRESPLVGLELEFERDPDTGRDVDFAWIEPKADEG